MLSQKSRGGFARTALVLAVSALLALALTTPSGAVRQTADRQVPDRYGVRAKPAATLAAVGSRYVSSPIPIRGTVRGEPRGSLHRLVLQRYSVATKRWVKRASKQVGNGSYRFAAQFGTAPGRLRFRTVLFNGRRVAAISNVIAVPILARPVTCATAPSQTTCPRPAPLTQERTVDVPFCPQLIVNFHRERRTVDWRWDTTTKRWVQDPSPWATIPGTSGQRAAGAPDCVKLISQVPANAALPDLRIKDLTKCGAGDSQATGGTCFMIVPSAPFNPDFPSLQGRKLLKFGVITLNAGSGPGEIIADRSSEAATEWKAYQTFYDASHHLLGSMVSPNVQFYFAGDGHNHWHVRDFDNYGLLSADGTTVAVAEKHGYCMQDNTTYSPLVGAPGVPNDPVYLESTSCGKGLPNALTIIHGLSRGWGDTYPTSLPDQAIDITGVPDGTYTVRVHADAVGAVRESNENNNTASVKVTISGDNVSVVPGTSTGGLP